MQNQKEMQKLAPESEQWKKKGAWLKVCWKFHEEQQLQFVGLEQKEKSVWKMDNIKRHF